MINIIQSWQAKRVLKKKLLAFLGEMEKNLEFYYVMDQRQFIVHGFLTDVWGEVKDLEIVNRHKDLEIYANAILDFNKSFNEYKSYEQWYSSDMKNKTNDNAKKLHALKNGLDAKVKPMETIIITAGQSLEKELLNLGFITH